MKGGKMKTFKLISLDVLNNGKFHEVKLIDGLIIDKENEQNTWLIEVYTTPDQADFFEKNIPTGEPLIVRVVISKKDNDPVYFHIKNRSVRKLEKNMSIMLIGTIKHSERNYPEQLLQKLLKKGLQGEKLFNEFKEKMKLRPFLALDTNTSPIATVVEQNEI
jgi:hypothetical protein